MARSSIADKIRWPTHYIRITCWWRIAVSIYLLFLLFIDIYRHIVIFAFHLWAGLILEQLLELNLFSLFVFTYSILSVDLKYTHRHSTDVHTKNWFDNCLNAKCTLAQIFRKVYTILHLGWLISRKMLTD